MTKITSKSASQRSNRTQASKYKKHNENQRQSILDREYRRHASRKRHFTKNDSGVHVHYFALHKHFHSSPVVQFLNITAQHFVVLREDSSMELWDSNGCIRSMTGRQNARIRNIFFHNGHIISTGLDGFIRIWDFAQFRILHQFPSHGGPIWHAVHIEHNNFLLACDDGKARLVQIEHPAFSSPENSTQSTPTTNEAWECNIISIFTPTIIHTTSTSMTNTACLHCVAYLPAKRRILCGGPTGVYCFDLDTALLNFHITSRGARVWCLEPLDNDQFALGDAAGYVSICEARYGTIVHQYKAHNEDVMRLCAFYPLSSAGYKRELLSLASVGVDGQFVCYKQLTPCQWAFDSSLRASLHDLLCISPHIQAFDEGTLLLGGVEGNIIIVPPNLGEESLRKLRLDIVGSNVVTVAPDTGILAMHDNQQSVLVMYAPLRTETEVRQTRYINPSFDYAPSIVLKMRVETDAGWNISSLALSPDARFLAITTPDLVELIELDHNRENHACEIVSRVNLRQRGLTPGYNVRFASNDLLVLTDRRQQVQFFNISSMEKLSGEITTGHETLSELQKAENFFPATLDTIVSRALIHAVQCIAANKDYAVIAYGHHLDIYDVKNIAAEEGGAVEPNWTIPFPHGVVCSIQLDEHNLHVMASNYAFSHFDLSKKVCSIERGFFPMMLDGHSFQEDSLCPHVHEPYRDTSGPIRFVKQLRSNTFLMASSTSLYAYNPRQHRVSSVFIWNERTRHTVVSMETLGKKQILVCVSPFTEQLYELPPVLYRKRVGAS